MEEQKQEKQPEKTEAELKEEFWKEYKELVKKHGFDFFISPPVILKVNFIQTPPEPPKEDKKDANIP